MPHCPGVSLQDQWSRRARYEGVEDFSSPSTPSIALGTRLVDKSQQLLADKIQVLLVLCSGFYPCCWKAGLLAAFTFVCNWPGKNGLAWTDIIGSRSLPVC